MLVPFTIVGTGEEKATSRCMFCDYAVLYFYDAFAHAIIMLPRQEGGNEEHDTKKTRYCK